VQVDPIKPTLTAPGIKILQLTYDKPLSNFGFKFNLRRYNKQELCQKILRGSFTLPDFVSHDVKAWGVVEIEKKHSTDVESSPPCPLPFRVRISIQPELLRRSNSTDVESFPPRPHPLRV
jgi:hypothetical protein